MRIMKHIVTIIIAILTMVNSTRSDAYGASEGIGGMCLPDGTG
jgi:hypothetical protein